MPPQMDLRRLMDDPSSTAGDELTRILAYLQMQQSPNALNDVAETGSSVSQSLARRKLMDMMKPKGYDTPAGPGF